MAVFYSANIEKWARGKAITSPKRSRFFLLSQKYSGVVSLGHANILAAELGHSNRTQHHCTQPAPPKNGYKMRFLASWPPKTPDITPLDYCVWSILENKVGIIKYKSVEQLMQALRREWVQIPQKKNRAACDGFSGRLKAIIRAKGDQYEQI